MNVKQVWCPLCQNEVEVSIAGIVLDHSYGVCGWGRDAGGHRVPSDLLVECAGHGIRVHEVVDKTHETGVLLIGDRVRVRYDASKDRLYSGDVRCARPICDGSSGTIMNRKDGHGVCFRVNTDVGVAWYEPSELVPL